MRTLFVLMALVISSPSMARNVESLGLTSTRLVVWPSASASLKAGDSNPDATARQTVKELFESILDMDPFDASEIDSALKQMGIQPQTSLTMMPKVEDMLKLGRTVKADYVLAYQCDWKVKQTFFNLRDSNQPSCTFSAIIVDMATNQVVYRPKELTLNVKRLVHPSDKYRTIISLDRSALSKALETLVRHGLTLIMADWVEFYQAKQSKLVAGSK